MTASGGAVRVSQRKSILHVNRNTLASNLKHGRVDPPLTCRQGSTSRTAHEIDLLDASGKVVATFVYRPDRPLHCGARVWVETDLEVRLREWEAE